MIIAPADSKMTYEETVCEERNNGGNRITRNVNRYILLRQKERKRPSGEVSFIDPCHLVEMEVETNVQSAQTEENENESKPSPVPSLVLFNEIVGSHEKDHDVHACGQ